MIKITPNSKFGYTTYPLDENNIIEISEEDLSQIGITKCFSSDLKSVIPYTPPEPKPSYEALAASKINAKYSADEENAILRKTLMALYSELGGTPSSEFQKYYDDAEACKAEARAEIAKNNKKY